MSESQQQPAHEAERTRRECIPRVLDAYAEDLERNHVPTDSGLPHALRLSASMLREMQEASELLDNSGEAVGNEHRRYAFIERVRNLITCKSYAWRKRDEYEALNNSLGAALDDRVRVIELQLQDKRRLVAMCEELRLSLNPALERIGSDMVDPLRMKLIALQAKAKILIEELQV